MAQDSFGKLLRYYRRNSQDQTNGGSLSQDRLADLLAREYGLVYSRGAISDWERGKGHIHKDSRHLLVSLIRILHEAGGIHGLEDTNKWLEIGNYRALNQEEITQISLDWLTPALAAPEQTIFNAPRLPAHKIIGRDELLQTLKQQIFSGRNLALSALNGLPGIGKTTLALLLAHDAEVRERFADGVLWAGLGRNPDIFHLLGAWAVAVGVPSDEVEKMGAIKLRANAIHDLLKTKQMLLVIDDVWDSSAVPLFKLGGRYAIHVMTTRQPRIAVEFAGENSLKVPELADEYAFELLRQLAPRVVAQEEGAAWEIVKISGRLPLALILIGNYLRIHESTGRKRRIQAALAKMQLVENRFDLERNQSILDQEVHPSLPFGTPISLKTIVGVSDSILSLNAQKTLRALAVFPPKPNSFSEEAALFVAATDLEALDELSDHGLLETTNRERYTLHQSICDYAQLQGSSFDCLERFIIYYRNFAAEFGNEQSLISQELDNIMSALKTAEEINRFDLQWALLDAIFPFLEMKGYYDLALDYLEPLAAKELAIPGKIKVQAHLGRIAYKLNNNETAAAYWQTGLYMAKEAQAHDEALSLLASLSMIASEAGQHEEAEQYLAQAIPHAVAAENWYELCRIQGNLGRLAIIKDRYEQADAFLMNAISVAEEHDFASLACALYNMRGIVARNLGQLENAYQFYFSGLQIARKNQFTTRILEQLVNLGELLNDLQRFDEAAIYLEEGLSLARELGDLPKEGHLLLDLGIAALGLKQLDKANQYFTQGYEMANEAKDLRLVAHILSHWGMVELDIGRLDVAAGHFEDSLKLVPQISRHAKIAGLAHFGLAKIAFSQGNRAKAEHESQLGLQAVAETGHPLFDEITAWRSQVLGNNL